MSAPLDPMVKHTRSPSSEETSPSRGSKPKRAAASALAIATTSSWSAKRARGARRRRLPIPRRSWAELDYGLAGVIAERALAADVSDYMSFRAVCREWRRGTDRPQGCLDCRFYPRRWIMLREAAPFFGSRRRRFLNVSTGQCIQMELPEVHGLYLLGATTEGLIALVNESTYVVRLVNPATRQLVELPSLGSLLFASLLFARIHRRLGRFKLTGFGLADDSTVALCVLHELYVASPGDDHWTKVDVPYDRMRFHSAVSFSGRFYCATSSAVMVLEARADNNNNKQWRLEMVALITKYADTLQLLESDGQLLLIRSLLPRHYSKGTTKYQVCRVDLDAHKVVLLRGLRDRVVFFGEVRALSVSTGTFPSIRSNTVYLGYDLSDRIENGVVAYNLRDKRITERGNKEDDGWAWTRPCGIGEYLSWYVSGECGRMEEI